MNLLLVNQKVGAGRHKVIPADSKADAYHMPACSLSACCIWIHSNLDINKRGILVYVSWTGKRFSFPTVRCKYSSIGSVAHIKKDFILFSALPPAQWCTTLSHDIVCCALEIE